MDKILRIGGRVGQNFLSIRFSDSTGLITYIPNFKVSGIKIDNTLIFGIETVKVLLNYKVYYICWINKLKINN